jgi:hypothetical protein
MSNSDGLEASCETSTICRWNRTSLHPQQEYHLRSHEATDKRNHTAVKQSMHTEDPGNPAPIDKIPTLQPTNLAAKTATRYWPPKNPSSSASTAQATNSRALPQTAISSKSIACLTKRTRIYSATTSLALGLMWRRARFRRSRGLGGLSLGIRRRRTRLLERALGSMLWLGISF